LFQNVQLGETVNTYNNHVMTVSRSTLSLDQSK